MNCQHSSRFLDPSGWPPLLLLASACVGAGLWAQEPPAPTLYREAPRKFSQQIEVEPGKVLQPGSLPLPQRKTLDFTVKGMPVDEPVDAEGARARIVKRIQAANDKVTSCLGLVDGVPTLSTDQILEKLRLEAGKATGDLAQDLNNLLIAGLVTIDVGEGAAQAVFKTWSYRQINDVRALCGPTIIAHPNSTLLIPVLNLMDLRDLELSGFPVQKTVPLADTDLVNTPHGFDICNLHTHGLNVSPSWPADDVFREIHPFQLKFFVYHLYGDHPIGTFWYHPHKHGAVGPQVASGMAGALLVQAEGCPEGLDLVAREKKWKECDPLILQQLTAYKPTVPAGGPFVFRPDFFALKYLINEDHITEVGSVGYLAQWMKDHLDNVDPEIRTLISGRFLPALPTRKCGETIRMRLIHAGIEDDWRFSIHKSDGTAVPAEQMSIQVIAWDGLVLEEPYIVTDDPGLKLSPGNRAEVLVHFAEGAQGKYGIFNGPKSKEAFATFDVEAGDNQMPALLTKEEVKVWKLFKEPPAKPATAPVDFIVHIKDKSVVKNGSVYEIDPGAYHVNGASYPGTPRHFRLNEKANLRLGSTATGHPIHIHVNPVLLDPSEDRKKAGLPGGRYWTDTVLAAGEGYTGVMPFDHWDGRTVVHCHILDHEDNGMMNALLIRPERMPVAPLPGVFDLTSLPKPVLALLKPVWPKAAPSSGIPNGSVTVVTFLPRSLDAKECAHCAAALQAIGDLRNQPGAPDFRIVAVTGPNDSEIADLADGLGLDYTRDVLCVDPALRAFQALGLIDGVPVLDPETGLYTFPQSFRKDGAIIHDGDVMHGVFILDGDGFVAASNRSFIAFDDMEEILAEIKQAGTIGTRLADYSGALKKIQEAAPGRSQTIQRETLNLQRQQARYSAFQRRVK